MRKCSVVGCNNVARWKERSRHEVYYCDFCRTQVGVEATELVFDEKSEFGKFMRMVDESREAFMATMNFLIAENDYRALEVICRGNNWQGIAFGIANMFHRGQYNDHEIDLRVLKAKGYDHLRGIVADCVQDLRGQDRRMPDGYDRLVNRLFTSHGLPTPN